MCCRRHHTSTCWARLDSKYIVGSSVIHLIVVVAFVWSQIVGLLDSRASNSYVHVPTTSVELTHAHAVKSGIQCVATLLRVATTKQSEYDLSAVTWVGVWVENTSKTFSDCITCATLIKLHIHTHLYASARWPMTGRSLAYTHQPVHVDLFWMGNYGIRGCRRLVNWLLSHRYMNCFDPWMFLVQ